MAARNKYFKDGRKKNNKAINEFLGEVVGAVTVGTASSMRKVAQRGIQRLVNNVAGFSDYSGMLINSYQAAILTRGKLRTNAPSRYGYKGDFDLNGNVAMGHMKQGEFKNASGGTVVMTSYRANGTTKISRKDGGRLIRKRRNPESKEPLNRIIPGKILYEGHGWDLTKIKSYTPSVREGIEVVFDNPTPYAEHVHKKNEGSTVMPMGMADIVSRGSMVSITTQEIRKAVKNAKTRKKRR